MVGESEEEEDEDQEYNEDEGEDSKFYGKLRDDFDNPIKVVFKKPRGSYSKGHDSFFPASMLFFILNGAYGVERYGFPVVSALTTDTKTLEGDARSSGESHISGGFGVVQKCVLPAVVRIDVGSIGKKLHRDVALEVRDTATDTHH